MDSTSDTLQKKLQERRKAMNITMQTTDSTALDVTTINNDDSDGDADIPTIGDEETASTSRLIEKLESRHDATRKRLQTSEMLRPQSDVRLPTSRLQESPRSITPAMSPGQSQELSRPQSDLESTFNSTFGTRSAGMSLRDRLQAKLQAAKQKREFSQMGEERKRTQRLKERLRDSSTRFDVDPLRTLSRPDLEKERELETRVLAKLQWKKVLQKARKQIGQPSDIDCYDFFTKQFEEVTVQPEVESPDVATTEEHAEQVAEEEIEQAPVVEDQPETAADAQDEQPTEEVEETDDEKKKLLSEIIPEELDWKLFNIMSAEYISYRIRLETEQQISFVPSILNAPSEKKVLDNAAPMYLEEEGFYVGLMPEVQIRNRNILENRILSQEKQDDKAWFGLDGRVKILPSPVQIHPNKPWVSGLDDIDPSIETIYVKAYQTSVDEKYLQGSQEHELQVDLGTAVFHHHPLMSREHVLASSISEMYDAYIRHRHKNYAVFYYEKLRSLRLALKTMKRNASAADGEDIAILGGQELRIQDYLTEIRRTCRQRDLAEAYERDLMRKIVAEWKEIKALRTAQGFNNSGIKLTVKKQEVNQESDRQAWMQEIDVQIQECQEEFNYTVQYPYRKLLTEYQSNLQDWKKTRIKLKRQQKSESSADLGMTEEESLIVGPNPKPLKPLPPAKFDENAVREQLINQALQHRRNPGEPKISLEVTHTGPITPNVQLPAGEATRRIAVQNSRLVARVKFNGRDVCTSEEKSLTSDFRVHFGQIFKILISQWPDSVRIQIYELGRLSDTILDEINLAIPDGSVNTANVQLFPVDFSNDKVVIYRNHEGVGSSTPFTLRSDSNVPVSLKTCGQLYVSIAWSLDADGRVLAPKLMNPRGNDAFDAAGRPHHASQIGAQQSDGLAQYNLQDPDLMALWSQEGKLDPNDPANLGMVTYTSAKEGFTSAMDYFRLDQLQQQFNFVTDEEMGQARRLRLLEYRATGISEFRNLSMVPANEHEILDSAFTAYERHKREKDALGEMGERKVAAGSLSAHRLEVLRFRQKVRDSVMRRFYTARHYHTLQDMVHEDQVPDIGTLGLKIIKIAEPRRPLKPVRSERKKATTQNLTEGSVSVLITVVRAYNLPIRDKTPVPGLEGSLSRAVLGTTNLHQQSQDEREPFKLSPFVSVSFQNNVKATNIAEGPNPSWNEEIELPFSATNNDYTPENLQTIDDTLFINIFDRVVRDANVDTRDRDDVGESSGVATGVVSHRVQNHWLGSLKIPFTTIYQQGKIEGTFKLNVPQVMLGYTPDRANSSANDPYAQMESQFLQPTDGSYIGIFVTLEPQLGRPEPVPQKFETQEDERLISESLKFEEECKKKFPKRRIKTTVIDIKGESVFITRYVKPIAPPPELLEGTSQNSLVCAEKLARYVSLIPFVSDNVIYAGKCDLWSTCDQFLNMLCGDEEEHAILLLNFFLHIGKQAYLVLGRAIPEGETAYVLTLEQSQEYFLWNASNGHHYKATDFLCPLQNVFALVNQDNIWFNMQVHDIPARVNFNTNQGWKPLFKSISATQGLTSVQPEVIVYPETELSYVQNLEEMIERTLKEAMMDWRPRHVTRWNRSCSTALHQILRSLEIDRWKLGGADDRQTQSRTTLLQDDHAERLTRLIGDARFVGFPMDMPFTDIDAVVKAVRSTEVHKIQDNDIEFALGVYIHPYPSSVLCVWVYVAAINASRSF
ncbi:coiled-coil and C2 domain-containing protein 2A-like isoform X2 [Styela clava]